MHKIEAVLTFTKVHIHIYIYAANAICFIVTPIYGDVTMLDFYCTNIVDKRYL